MYNFWKKSSIPRPLLFLAPMAGYTESAFRLLIKRIEPSVILVSELISAEAIFRGNQKTLDMMRFSKEESPFYGVQIFGNRAESFFRSAEVIAEMGADFININLGCPSPKVIGSGFGSALLKNPDKTTELIEKLVKKSSLPITVKMRLGFYDDKILLPFTKNLESVGVSLIAIHGRTAVQKFKGRASWEKIYAVKNQLSIPVIGNGDITSAVIAKNRLKNLDGVMIGRSALTNPWIFSQTREIFAGKNPAPKPSIVDHLGFFREIATITAAEKGEKKAMLGLRKHFAHMIRGIPKAGKFREKLIRVETLVDVEEIFSEIVVSYKGIR